MGNSLLEIKPHQVSRDLRGYSVLFYGEPKSGKTTIASKFPGALVLAFEKGYSAIPGIMAKPMNSWNTRYREESIRYGLYSLDSTKNITCCKLLALSRDVYKDDISKLALSKIGNAHIGIITLDATPLVVVRVLQFNRNISHSFIILGLLKFDNFVYLHNFNRTNVAFFLFIYNNKLNFFKKIALFLSVFVLDNKVARRLYSANNSLKSSTVGQCVDMLFVTTVKS